MKFCPQSAVGKVVLFGIVAIFWLAAVILIFKIWRTDPVTVELSPKTSFGTIRFQMLNEDHIDSIMDDLEDFLEPYEKSKERCKHRNGTCAVDLKDFYPCIKENQFGYKKGTPCVFLKLSVNGNFTPKFYNETNLPEVMPERLKEIIKSNSRNGDKNSDIVWISCDGKSPSDIVDMGPIAYLPHWNFPGFRFSCLGKDHCVDPLLAIYFRRPKAKTTIKVECKIWARNLHETINFKLYLE